MDVYEGRVVGYGSGGAVIWPTPSSYIGLNPTAYSRSEAFGIFGNQQVGGAFFRDGYEHAMLWSGSAESAVDLGYLNALGNSYATATDGMQQVGIINYPGVTTIAALWSGTANTFVNLNPSGYQSCAATGVYDGVQVGYGSITNGGTQALIWHGSASSVAVLSNGARAMGISRGQVVGWIVAQHPNTYDAAMWSVAGDFVNLAPAGVIASELFSTNGSQQVGDVSLTGAPPNPEVPLDHNPAVWAGTASSFQLLPLPQGDNQGFAYGIDDNGDIAGVAFAFQNGNFTTTVPVLWVPRRLPGDTNLDGKVDFSDLLILASHYGQPGGWADGEFSGGGTVDFADLLILAQNYGTTQAAVGYSVVALPEPSAVLLAVCGLGLIRRRRR